MGVACLQRPKKLALLSFGSLGLLLSNLHAATFLVTNNSESGAGSLRQAILDANTSGGGAITFSYERVQFQDGKVQVWFVTEPNQIYPIQTTTNFLSWQTIGAIPATSSGQFLFEDNPNLPARFYRILLSP